MSALMARAPGKVNLCLLLGPTRPDGRHELVSVVQPLSLADELCLEPAPAGVAADEVICPGVHGENLAARALTRFREVTGWDAPPQRLTIAKRVPVAAGMGGGSGDAAATLRLAAAASGLGTPGALEAIAAELGSDVPAQLRPARALVGGAGERVHPLGEGEPLTAVVLPSAGSLSTATVFARADRLGLGRAGGELADAESHILGSLRGAPAGPTPWLGTNDLAPAAIDLDPEIEVRLEHMRGVGADVSMVSGSGPTVVGLFLGPQGAQSAAAAAQQLPGGAIVAAPVGAGFGDPGPG